MARSAFLPVSYRRHMGIAPSLLSFHLRQMTQVGLLVEHRSSLQVIYAVNKEVMDALCTFLATVAAKAI